MRRIKFIHFEWDVRWRNNIQMEYPCKQTKHWFPTLNKSKSLQLLKCDRREYSIFVQAATGHNHLAKYEHKIHPQKTQVKIG